jgi:hypothetical protein
MNKELIRKGYIKQYLEEGKLPVSVYAFCKKIKGEEEEFYKFYNSLEAVEKDIWLSWHQETLDLLEKDTTYASYSAREKLLAFYFTWVQKLKSNRSFILLKKRDFDLKNLKDNALVEFKKAFEAYSSQLVKQGIEEREVIERKFISDKYANGFWLQLLFVLNYWTNDESVGFEQTDAAIEKAVNLSFKLIGESTLDSLIDFGKFILQK